jgi:hypothetical protein
VKASISRPERKSKTSIAISVAAHVVLFLGLAAITFQFPIVSFIRPPATPEQTIRYIKVAPPKPAASAGVGRTSRNASAVVGPTIVLAPTTIPTSVPAAVPPTVAPGAVIGPTNRIGGRDTSAGVGVQPGIPDRRLAINPMDGGRLPRTNAQMADSALSAIYQMYVDSVKTAMANRGRDPGDWSWGGKDGDKWGWDPNGIHLGGITIPNAVLAALPLNMGPSGSSINAITDARMDNYMRMDIKRHENMMTEEDFRSAVNRIHARIDRERQEKMAKKRKDPPPP